MKKYIGYGIAAASAATLTAYACERSVIHRLVSNRARQAKQLVQTKYEDLRLWLAGSDGIPGKEN